MLAHEVLRAAIVVLDRTGWCQDANARDSTGREIQLFTGSPVKLNPAAASFSLYGAVCKAAEGKPQPEAARMWVVLNDQADKALKAPRGGNNYVHPALGYNNSPGRTVAEVKALLEASAVECETMRVKED